MKALDIDMQDLLVAVKTTRHSRFNAPDGLLSNDDAELDRRQRLSSRLLALGFIPPMFTHRMKHALMRGDERDALRMLRAVIGLDDDETLEGVL